MSTRWVRQRADRAAPILGGRQSLHADGTEGERRRTAGAGFREPELRRGDPGELQRLGVADTVRVIDDYWQWARDHATPGNFTVSRL